VPVGEPHNRRVRGDTLHDRARIHVNERQARWQRATMWRDARDTR